MIPKIITKKGGRPAKNLAEKRKYRLSLKLNTNEYFQLKSKAKIAGKNRCDFLREFILTGEVRQRFTPEQTEMIKKIGGESNNLNQFVKLAHTQGVWYIEMKARELMAELDALLKQIKL